MLLVLKDGTAIATTGISTALPDEETAKAWWLEFGSEAARGQKGLTFQWLHDDSVEASRIVANGGRATVRSDGSLFIPEPPSSAPSEPDRHLADAERLAARKLALQALGEPTDDVDAKLAEVKVKFQVATKNAEIRAQIDKLSEQITPLGG